MLGVLIEPLAKWQRIHMTPPHGPCLVCPPSSPLDVEMTSEVPTPPLVGTNNDVVEALRVESAKCKLDDGWELELIQMKHTNEVIGWRPGLKSWLILWATPMYVMRNRALMDELDKLRSPWEQWCNHQLLFTYGCLWISCIMRGF